MRRRIGRSIVIVSFVLSSGACRKVAFAVPSPVMVVVDKGVSLEVVDWGGAGRPVVLLAGLGGTAHTFDGFASKLIPRYHVYGITRRGFGRSSVPSSGYSADRLGDDVLAVVDALKLVRPVLVGHSIAGEELSSVASRHPEKVSGLVYLDAAYGYAYYDHERGDFTIDLNELIEKLTDLQPSKGPQDPKVIRELLERQLPQFEEELRQLQFYLEKVPPGALVQGSRQMPAAVPAIIGGMQKYSNLSVPILAMFADPHTIDLDVSSETRTTLEQQDAVFTEAQVRAFEKGVPSARVVRLPHASHNIFVSNEADVVREMDLFIGTLP